MPHVKLLNVSVLIFLLMWSCSKNDNKTTDPPQGEESLVSIIIDQGAVTRSSSNDTEQATGPEIALDYTQGLKVYVFNYEGELEYSSSDDPAANSDGCLFLSSDGSGKYVTTPFSIRTGLKHFFVFANDGNTALVLPPSSGMILDDFSKQIIGITYANDIPSITGDEFLLGTLWREAVGATSGGTQSDPVTVELEIGRLVAKINLNEVILDIHQDAGLLGAFSEPSYRIGTIPRKIHTAGVHVGDLAPYEAAGVLVTSAVHQTGILTGPTDANYVQYSSNWKDEKEIFYVAENTTAPDAVTHEQFFGNTTYIQLKTVYTPVTAEIYDPTDLTSGHTLDATGTFWTVVIKDDPIDPAIQLLAGKTVIVNAEPQPGTMHGDIVPLNEYPCYTGGVNYHKFPVFDKGETQVEIRNRVLRNHYYEFTVTEFLSLGSHEPDVDPQEPIPDFTTVNVRVTVKDWDKVTGSTPVG